MRLAALMTVAAVGAMAVSADETCGAVPRHHQEVVQVGPLPYLLPRRTPTATTQTTTTTTEEAIKSLIRSNLLPGGERWEVDDDDDDDLAVFRYWNLDMKLEPLVDMKSIAGRWRNKSHAVHESSLASLDFSQCQKRHYAMLSPLPSAVPRLLALVLPMREHFGDLDAQLFASCAGTGTALHFDRNDNYFYQIEGRKRFHLYSPDRFAELRYAPRHHPLYRQSLLDLSEYYYYGEKSSMTVELKPGDVLFVPRLWGHFVVSETDSCGLAVRRRSLDGEEEAMRKVPLPFELDWALPTKYAAVKLYLTRLLTREQRQSIADNWRRALLPFGAEEAARLLPELDPAVRNKIERYAERIAAAGFTREMLLIEYCEDVVSTMFSSAKESAQFVFFYMV